MSFLPSIKTSCSSNVPFLGCLSLTFTYLPNPDTPHSFLLLSLSYPHVRCYTPASIPFKCIFLSILMVRVSWSNFSSEVRQELPEWLPAARLARPTPPLLHSLSFINVTLQNMYLATSLLCSKYFNSSSLFSRSNPGHIGSFMICHCLAPLLNLFPAALPPLPPHPEPSLRS